MTRASFVFSCRVGRAEQRGDAAAKTKLAKRLWLLEKKVMANGSSRKR